MDGRLGLTLFRVDQAQRLQLEVVIDDRAPVWQFLLADLPYGLLAVCI